MHRVKELNYKSVAMKENDPLKNLIRMLKIDPSANDTFASLSRALELFSLETDRLQNAYNSLKEEFTSIHSELELTNKKLIKKIAELDVMSFYFESILSNIAQGILFINLNGDVTTYNNAARKILKIDAKDVLHHPFWQNFEDDIFGFSVREALASHNPPSLAHSEFTSNGDKRALEVNATFVKEEGRSEETYYQEVTVKKLEGIIILIRDITEIQYLQMVANRNDRMKVLGEMAAMVAHEIRNPLGGIKGFASLLRRDLKDNPHLVEMANNIISGTDILNNLVTNVLNYSRPLTPNFSLVDLDTLIEGIKKHFEVDIANSEKKIKIIIKKDVNDTFVLIDPNLMKLVILNLLFNARDAIDESGEILIELGKTNKNAFIKISDNGCGISENDLEKIFTPFFTTKAQGNGFGLSEVHKVIQAHNGRIEVESKIKQGTTFTIELPLVKGESNETINISKEPHVD